MTDTMPDPVGGSDNSSNSTSDGTIDIGAKFRSEVEDAARLLEYATKAGLKGADGSTIGDDVREPIIEMAALLGVGCPTDTQSDCTPVPRQTWLAFTVAYHRLAALLAPVTAATLEATANRHGSFGGFFLGRSAALRFTRTLWISTGFFGLFAVGVEWAHYIFGPTPAGIIIGTDGSRDHWYTLLQLLEVLVPFAYGGLGSCVYLLRSAHIHIADRSFDVRREPEYYNRILLGLIGGGAVVLFVDSVTDESGDVIELSTAALGFLAGYSTDFLFQTIERVIAAVLPRVGLDSVRRHDNARPPLDIPVGNLTLEQLIDKYEKATSPDDKSLYKGLINRLRDRI